MFALLEKLLGRGRDEPLGRRGEAAAAKFLARSGYKIVARNYRCQMGEIDLIARDGPTLVFVEVKSRQDDEPTPEQQVNSTKQHQLTKSARHYLSRFGSRPPPARFDVIAVVWPEGREPRIRHTIDAFEASF
jgi:putative endonuclease